VLVSFLHCVVLCCSHIVLFLHCVIFVLSTIVLSAIVILITHSIINLSCHCLSARWVGTRGDGGAYVESQKMMMTTSIIVICHLMSCVLLCHVGIVWSWTVLAMYCCCHSIICPSVVSVWFGRHTTISDVAPGIWVRRNGQEGMCCLTLVGTEENPHGW
jgi:hypothetical protein